MLRNLLEVVFAVIEKHLSTLRGRWNKPPVRRGTMQKYTADKPGATSNFENSKQLEKQNIQLNLNRAFKI